MSAFAKRNRLVHKGYGVYRLATHYQPTEFDGYVEVVLLGGDETTKAYLGEVAIWR